jgi:hypothetical protein
MWGESYDNIYFEGLTLVSKMDNKLRDKLLKYKIGPEQIQYLDNIEQFFNVNHFDSLI